MIKQAFSISNALTTYIASMNTQGIAIPKANKVAPIESDDNKGLLLEFVAAAAAARSL
eukprot:CAMPEP_0168226340 /NCGR_PEP_ID=MMETSP0140_2-20121125/13337_1 /TAXON_ID=44445 /ORGANISM="Pseudo-nitzschia australis, Strain 10249 10 AB" /LENGTH=57 /DNA_ID=CAMNT_0008157373 /DNA_START=996 /DNA_END=1169 /DNA_ORIENTATION=+